MENGACVRYRVMQIWPRHTKINRRREGEKEINRKRKRKTERQKDRKTGRKEERKKGRKEGRKEERKRERPIHMHTPGP
jgi:hypothetical protein